MAPAFVSAAIYLTLKHITLCFGPELKHFPARYYTWVFITTDIFSLVLQVCGGGIVATASSGSLLSVGTGLMMAGIVLQVVTLLVFGAISVDFALWLSRSTKPFSLEAVDMKNNLCFKLFLGRFGIGVRDRLHKMRVPHCRDGGWMEESDYEERNRVYCAG
jgi:hypothetical protein